MLFKREYTKVPTTKKPLRRLICRYGDSSLGDNKSVHDQGDGSSGSGKKELSGPNSSKHNKTSPDNSDPENVHKQVNELEETFPRFGPLYGKDIEVVKLAKDEAWKFMVDQAPEEERDSFYGIYSSAINKIYLQEARDAYDPDILEPLKLKTSEFQRMMIIDGCFFLQLALFILGGSEPLGYSETHTYFKPGNETEIKRIKAMFFVGNQVPCVVLRELMKQSFFQKVIAKGIEKGKWSLPSDNLPKMVLFLLVVSPELGEIASTWEKIKHFFLSTMLTCRKEAPYFPEKPSDVLHALHSLVLGPEVGDYEVHDDDDSELDLEAGTSTAIKETNSKDIFPSATELEQQGIKLAKAKGGIRQISFGKFCFIFNGRLYLPPFTFGSNPEVILRYLNNYEIAQKKGKNNREVGAYLCFMRDLIKTPMDVFVLQRRGIIEGQNRTRGDKLPRVLGRLCSEDIPLAQSVFLAKMAIKEYGSPERRFIIKITLLLTVIQTIFAVLSYKF